MNQSITPEVDIDHLSEHLDAVPTRATLVDVREPGEYAEGHVPGATLIPMGQLSDRMGEIAKDSPVFVICASGNRSRAMTDLLRAAGYDAASVSGGTSAWARSGRSIEGGLR